MKLNSLVLEHLNDCGFNTELWRQTASNGPVLGSDLNDIGTVYYYNIIFNIAKLIIIENDNGHGSSISVRGVPGFEVTVVIENPDSFNVIEKTLRDLYIWMKNINSDCVKELLHESKGFCSRTNI